MIYKNPNICESVALVGEDADRFLNESGITLYESDISINGLLVDGITGEKILESNGIFLYEDGIVLEGEQAEAYKARKAKEAEDIKKKDEERKERRYADLAGSKMTPNNPNYKDRYRNIDHRSTLFDDRRRDDKAEKAFDKERSKYTQHPDDPSVKEIRGQVRMDLNHDTIVDAHNRHQRRHSK